MIEFSFEMSAKELTYLSILDLLTSKHKYLSIDVFEKFESHERFSDHISLNTKYMSISITTYETNESLSEPPYNYDIPEFQVFDFEVFPYLSLSINYFCKDEEVIDVTELFKFLSVFMDLDKSDCILTSPAYDIIFFRKDNKTYFPENPSLDNDTSPNWQTIKESLKT